MTSKYLNFFLKARKAIGRGKDWNHPIVKNASITNFRDSGGIPVKKYQGIIMHIVMIFTTRVSRK